MYETLDKVEGMCKRYNELHRQAYFYDENERFAVTVLKQWFDDHQSILEKEKRLFILGERTSFSLKSAPVNTRLTCTDGENILFYGFEEVDFTNLCMMLVDSIYASKGAQLLINSADTDLLTILDVESWYTKDYMQLARPMSDVSEWLTYLEGVIESRRQSDSDTYGPLYFMCLRWDKQHGLCRDEQYRLTDRWKAILSDGPAVDVHTILGVQLYREVPTAIISKFNHIICARGPEDASRKYLDSTKASRLPDNLGFAVYKYATSVKTFKIYQHEFTKKAETRELEL
jgi:hypothetical protein